MREHAEHGGGAQQVAVRQVLRPGRQERQLVQLRAQAQGAVVAGHLAGRLIPGRESRRQGEERRLARHEAVALRQEAEVLVAEPRVDPLCGAQDLARAARLRQRRAVAEQRHMGGAVVALVADAAGVAVLAVELVQVAIEVAALLGGEAAVPEVVERLGAVAGVHSLEEEHRHVAAGEQLLEVAVLEPRAAHVEHRAGDGGVHRAVGQRRQGELAVGPRGEAERPLVVGLVHVDGAQPLDVARVEVHLLGAADEQAAIARRRTVAVVELGRHTDVRVGHDRAVAVRLDLELHAVVGDAERLQLVERAHVLVAAGVQDAVHLVVGRALDVAGPALDPEEVGNVECQSPAAKNGRFAVERHDALRPQRGLAHVGAVAEIKEHCVTSPGRRWMDRSRSPPVARALYACES